MERNPQYREPLEHLAKIIAIQVTPLNESMAWGVRNALWMLFAAVALLLLLVLFNLGNLLVTRNANRLREYAIRQALGGSRWQLFRQAVTEQGMLIALAAILSLSLSSWAIELVRKIGAAHVPRLSELWFDTHGVLLLLGLAFATALTFGALPLLVMPDSVAWFRSESRSSTGDRRSAAHSRRAHCCGNCGFHGALGKRWAACRQLLKRDECQPWIRSEKPADVQRFF